MTGFNLFVYGTLKPGEINYPIYCGDRVLSAVRAYTWGQLYHLSLGYPGMAEGRHKVQGYLLTFADKSCLAAIDRLEDYRPDRPIERNEYQRCLVPAFSPSDRYLGEGWGYRMLDDKIRQYSGIPIPSGWWVDPKRENPII